MALNAGQYSQRGRDLSEIDVTKNNIKDNSEILFLTEKQKSCLI